MKTEELTIEGMTCGHCIVTVKKALANLPHTTVEDVQIGRAQVQYDESKVKREDLAKAISEAGYELVG